MLTGHGVSTRQAATLTGLVRSTVTRRCNAATALTTAMSAGVPQAGQLRSSWAPQAMQNCAAGGFSTAQLPQVREAFMLLRMMTLVRASRGLAVAGS